jgi:hypothetical protein
MTPKTIVICGMHRSGTSLATQWLYRSGLFVGDRLFPPGPANPDGHFEDMDFLELHEKFLAKRKFPKTGFISDNIVLTRDEKKEIETLIEKKKREHNQWGWKEPRTCLFLDVYRDILQEACYFIIVRDFNSTVNSMLSRDHKFLIEKISRKKGLSRVKWSLFKSMTEIEFYKKYAEEYLKIWINYYEKIINHVHSIPSARLVVTDIKSLLQRDEQIFNRVTQQWDLSLRYLPFTGIYKESLVSKVKRVDQYVNNYSLLIKARQIEKIVSNF